MDKLLHLLMENPRLTNEELAQTLGMTEQDVAAKIAEYENQGIIKGYSTVIDHDALQDDTVTALIEIKVKPKFGHGFDEIAERIAALEEVESVYLMSGSYDLCCIVSDKSFQVVSMFVSRRLSPTTTHFILNGIKTAVFCSPKSRRTTGGSFPCERLQPLLKQKAGAGQAVRHP